MDWTTIRDLCEANGLGAELQEFERRLPKYLAEELVVTTGKVERYLHDAEFHSQIDLLCVLVIRVLIKAHIAPADLRAVFADEVREHTT